MDSRKVDGDIIVDLIIETGEDIEYLISREDVDIWVKDSELVLQEFYFFDELTEEQLNFASRKIKERMIERMSIRPTNYYFQVAQ